MSVTILVAEDEAIIARDIQATLVQLGYRVPAVVATGEDALRVVAAQPPELVLMDICLQGAMDGIDTAARIREVHGIPVVYLTSYSDETTVARAKETGAYGYLLKPFTDRDLRTAIEVALQKHLLETRLAERERWFSTTLRSIGDAVIATDRDQRVTFMNVVAERITGWTSKEAEGKRLDEVFRLVDAATRRPLESPLSRALRDGFAVALPQGIVLSQRAGEERAIDDSAAPIVDDKGQVLGGVVIFRDVTERRQLEERVAQSERLASLGTLSAGMAHEINNPLSYALTNIDFVVEGLEALAPKIGALQDPAARALAGQIREYTAALLEAKEGGGRVHRIVHDLKHFGRLDVASRSIVELGEVLENAVRMTESVVRYHAELRREYQTTPFVEGNGGQLGQVFVNLLVNAAQAIGAGSAESNEIVIRTWTDDGGRAVVEVSDTGPGIPAEMQRRIFDPFFTTKAIGEGSGLGLSISHAIIQSHGGQISVESRPGHGASFRVALPPAPANTGAKPSRSAPPVEVGRGRVLAIDDEPAIGRAMSRVLARDHDVFVVTDPRIALERIANGETFDVILCDLMMPKMTGMDLHEALREARPDLARRVVFVTGGTFTASAEDFLRSVPNPTLTKPVDPGTLRRVIADYVGQSKLPVRGSE